MVKELLGYIADAVEVSNTEPLNLDVVKALGRSANIGYVISDDGTVVLQINGIGLPKITLNRDEVFEFEKDDDWEIKRIDVTTSSSTNLTVRYFFRPIKPQDLKNSDLNG